MLDVFQAYVVHTMFKILLVSIQYAMTDDAFCEP
jgi:hypothetical protein